MRPDPPLQLFIARMRRTLRLDAALLAVKYLDFLHGLPPSARPAELRRFHRRTHHEKIAQIGRLG